MSGKDLFEAMSCIDERFIDEAENCGMLRTMDSPWLRIASVAACLCLVMLSLWCIQPLLNNPYGPPPETTLPDLPEGFEDLSVILYVEEMTEDGFTGTVAGHPDTVIFKIGVELNVVITEDTLHEAADYSGCYVLVAFREVDPATASISAILVEAADPPDLN